MPVPSDPFLSETEAYIQRWHGIVAPNDSGRRLAAELAKVIARFEAERGRLRFEDEPSSFEAALEACAADEDAAGVRA